MTVIFSFLAENEGRDLKCTALLEGRKKVYESYVILS
jgi:hypothetical protein